jgi:CRISPR-associated protein, csn2 family
MKLRYYRLNIDFTLYDNKPNILIIENPYEFEKFVIALDDRINKRTSDVELFNKAEKDDFSKKVEIFFSPLDFKYDKKDIQKRLFNELIEDIQSSKDLEEFSIICSKFFEILDELKIYADYDLDFEEDFGLINLLKSFNVHLKDPEGRFAEKFIEYSSNMHRLLGKEIFIFISCIKYMNSQDVKFLIQHALYKGMRILFVENMQIDLNSDTNEYIIDNDLCELH